MKRAPMLFLTLALLAALSGCGKASEQYADIDGVITLNQQPAADLQVVFMPDPELGTRAPSSSAFTDAKGHYRLASRKRAEGALTGMYRVCIQDATVIGGQQSAISGQESGKTEAKKSRVPEAYTSAAQTPLRNIEVKPGKQKFDFDIKAVATNPKR